jgi:hypothetical protein
MNYRNLNYQDPEAIKQAILKLSCASNTGSQNAANVVLDDTDLVVVPVTELQAFADGIDHALLKHAGTGVSSTYVSTVSVGGTTFAQPAVHGEISSDEGYFHITYAGATGITVANLAAASTYVYIDNAGALQQQTSIPTRQDWSRKMFTMRIGVNAVTGLIVGFEYLNNPTGHYANSIRDLYTYLLAQGVPFKIGQAITGRVADLGFDVGAGTLMEFGGTGDINNANIRSYDAVANVSFILVERVVSVGANTDLPKFWDNAGTITPLGSTTCVAHRVYRFSNGTVVLQYGQGNYANMTLAKTGSRLEEYVLNAGLENATFLGWWLLEETATVTSGTPDAEFIEYTIGIQGGTSSSLSGCLLKGNNLSDLLDASAARTNLVLGNVDNTSDADKEVSTDQQTALDLKAPLASPTFTGLITGAKAVLNVAPTAIANYGLLNLGSGAFDGVTSGFFTGSASGTILAANAATGFVGDFLNYQVNGAYKLKIDNQGAFIHEKGGGTGNGFEILSTGFSGKTVQIGQNNGGYIKLGNTSLYGGWQGEGLNGVLVFIDNIYTYATRSLYPALNRSGATLQIKLGDNSAFTPIQGKLTTDTAHTGTGDVVSNGYLTLYDSAGTAFKVMTTA